jgi:parvulin-like peptidyl-prolyl isomerase
MRARLAIACLFGAVCVAGFLSAQLICGSVYFRDSIGVLCGRGRLLALVNGSGIYEADVRRAAREFQSLTAVEKLDPAHVEIQARSILPRLIANRRVESLAQREPISRQLIDREYNLLRSQIQPEMAWRMALHTNRLLTLSLRQTISADLRAQRWIEQQIANHVVVTADEALQYYSDYPERFSQPVRYRASHLFLAAPPETPPEVVKEKQDAIEVLSSRLAGGDNFYDLVVLFSEDEATKSRSGDLGFFSEWRMPPDFFAAIEKMRVGETSPVVRTMLGFHIIQLTDSKPGQQMTFDQTHAEIGLLLENQKRIAAWESLVATLSKEAQFVDQ